MGSKYRSYTSQRKTSVNDYRRMHPVWRGVGFVFIILIPIMAYAATDVLLKQNGIHNWFPLPLDLLASPGEFLYNLFPDDLLYIKLLFIVAFMFVFYIIFMLFSFLISSLFGVTERKDPFYVPPVRRRSRRIR